MLIRKKIALCLLTFGLIAVITSLFIGCANEKNPSTQSQVKEHLRNALAAIDAGDFSTAEQELYKCLELQPHNSLACTPHFPLITPRRRSGIVLRSWLDPFLAIGSLLNRFKIYERILANSRMERIIDDSIWLELPPEIRDLFRSDQRINFLAGNIGKISVGLIVLIDLFREMPLFTSDEIAILDSAIQILRDEHNEPSQRNENTRVYLALLSFLRLVFYTKAAIGIDSPQEFAGNPKAYCGINSEALRINLPEWEKSLVWLREGLITNPSDPATSQRRARESALIFINEFLSTSIWQEREKYFSGTPENDSFQRFYYLICGGANLLHYHRQLKISFCSRSVT